MNAVQTLHEFWSSFGWVAYDENSVPDDAEFPRITYDVVTDDFDSKASMGANLYVRSTSWSALEEKLQEINQVIGKGGKVINYDGGALWITKGTPFSRRYAESDSVKQIILNIQVEFISL